MMKIEMTIGVLIALLVIGIYALILVKAHWSVRIIVTILVIAGVIRVTAWYSATSERNRVWQRSVRPLNVAIIPGMQAELQRGNTSEVSAVLSRLGGNALLAETFFGRTNYPDFEDLFKPLEPMSSASGTKQ